MNSSSFSDAITGFLKQSKGHVANTNDVIITHRLPYRPIHNINLFSIYIFIYTQAYINVDNFQACFTFNILRQMHAPPQLFA